MALHHSCLRNLLQNSAKAVFCNKGWPGCCVGAHLLLEYSHKLIGLVEMLFRVELVAVTGGSEVAVRFALCRHGWAGSGVPQCG